MNGQMSIFDFIGNQEPEREEVKKVPSECISCENIGHIYDINGNVELDIYHCGIDGHPTLTENGHPGTKCKKKNVCKFSGHTCNKKNLWEVANSFDDVKCPEKCCRQCEEELCGARCNGAEHVQDLKDEDKEGICEYCGWWNKTNGYMGMVPGCFWQTEYPDELDANEQENHTCWMPNVEMMKVCGSCEHSNSFLYSGDVDHPEEDNDLYCDLWHFHNRHPENRRQLFEGKRRKNFGLGIYHRQHEYDTCDCWERKR